jgi:hypothetical protein
MANKKVFIERRSEGDYAIRMPNAERASATESTQAQAIDRAREMKPGSRVLVERVRNTSAGTRDKWRKP